MSDSFIKVFESIGSGSMDDLGKDLLGSFGGLVADLGKMLVALGTTMLLSLTLLKTPTIPTAVAAIAAGAAAMAIGGLMMGAARKGADSIAGGGGGGGGNYAAEMKPQFLKVQVEGKIKGRDIYITNQRYVEEFNTGS